ncbi:MAG: gamma carbonic anhydrase family protein [Nevskia sp.]|jgi:carbonic anhydrase/acetyltransferase-like protein (isoleucine patch superfamily)|nr:gamma carbonic anhydrase family protein [Nevskia sp.]
MLYALDDRRPQIAPDAFVVANATLIGSVILKSRASVWFNCVLRGDNDELIVGEESNVQDGSILHTDPGLKLVIGRGVTVGHLVMLHGCTIGDRTLIGMGSVVLNRAVIGSQSIVAAGSLVPEGKRFPDGVLLMGRPAKVVRELDEAERRYIAYANRVYLDNAERYRTGLRALESP